MSELFNLEKGRRIFTVSEITREIKSILEGSFGQVWVEGEISNFQTAASGHSYFTLKDDTSVIPAAMFVRINRGIHFLLENGIKVICFGKISAYASRGQYQIIVDKIEPQGLGALQLALEQLKKRLEKEGLFSPEHKKPLPYLPAKIGVVTSLSGAAIKDILKVLDRRFRDVNIIIRSAQVQGEGAKEDIEQAINDLNIFNESLAAGEKIEVMIVGRGGGSIEDLWAFNEEVVARAIYNSKIPVISAVGHERDWTIADLVADMRAPTPSAAAEIVIPKKEDLKERVLNVSRDLKRSFLEVSQGFEQAIDDLLHRLRVNIDHDFEISFSNLSAATKKLNMLNPLALIQQHKAKIMDLARQMHVRVGHYLKLRNTEFSALIDKLQALSPLNILGRGYSITFRFPENIIVKDTGPLKTGDSIKTKLEKGEILSKITEVKKNG